MELVTWSELLVMYKTNKTLMSTNSDTPVPYTTAIAYRAMVLNPAPGSEATHSNEVRSQSLSSNSVTSGVHSNEGTPLSGHLWGLSQWGMRL